MSKPHPQVDRPQNQCARSVRREYLTAVAFNIGVATFVLGAAWQLCGEPSKTDTDHRLKLFLICAGTGVAASAWIVGSRVSPRLKVAMICAILAVAVYKATESAREFDAAGTMLLPGRVFDGRWTHDGLGISFAVIPGWRSTIPLPQIIDSAYDSAERRGRLRLWANEQALFFRIEQEPVPSNAGRALSSIRLEAVRFRFASLDNVAATILRSQSVWASTPGVRIIRTAHFYRINELEFAEFEVVNEPRKSITQYVFARSGCYMLRFVLDAGSEEDRRLFQEFLRSIRITHRPTTFSE